MIDYAARARANRPVWMTDEMHEKAVRELHDRHREMLSRYVHSGEAHRVIGIAIVQAAGNAV
jgi:hypothetical protein